MLGITESAKLDMTRTSIFGSAAAPGSRPSDLQLELDLAYPGKLTGIPHFIFIGL